MRTVFVIGAGANVEIGMPNGKKLKQDIADRLDYGKLGGDSTILNALIEIGLTSEHASDIASTIREAMPLAISIDNFIDAHKINPMLEVCGKMAIVNSIQAAERQSRLYTCIHNYHGTEKLQETWYPLLFQKITEGCGINEFLRRLDNISFIVFNYDRCFESYMIYALETYYNIGQKKAADIVEAINIIHPYGIIGNIYKGGINAKASVYEPLLGEPFAFSELFLLSDNIRTFSEDSEKTKKERISISNLIIYTNRIIFLGFAYHPMNLDLLFNYDYDELETHKDCYGTGYGISENDIKHIQDTLKKMCPRINNCDISGVTCTQFFNDFWHRISFRD